eukprot:COSAG06_NODE_66164_length_255_cov_0.647436_1_plen_63_part_10
MLLVLQAITAAVPALLVMISRPWTLWRLALVRRAKDQMLWSARKQHVLQGSRATATASVACSE